MYEAKYGGTTGLTFLTLWTYVPTLFNDANLMNIEGFSILNYDVDRNKITLLPITW